MVVHLKWVVFLVSEILPLKQGLKHSIPYFVQYDPTGLRDTSIKTRIETVSNL